MELLIQIDGSANFLNKYSDSSLIIFDKLRDIFEKEDMKISKIVLAPAPIRLGDFVYIEFSKNKVVASFHTDDFTQLDDINYINKILNDCKKALK